MQRIRDEAHRFAITAHRHRRSKQGMASVLDSIPGIGPAKRKALLKHFGSVDKIKEATVEELNAVPGITPTLADVHKDKPGMKQSGSWTMTRKCCAPCS